MSGGGKSVSRGRMGQSVKVTNIDPRELENMEEVIQSLEQRIRELRQKQNALDGQINTLSPELNRMKHDYEKYTRDLQVTMTITPNNRDFLVQKNIDKLLPLPSHVIQSVFRQCHVFYSRFPLLYFLLTI